ncbi:unnamed protein product (macronuclear) [Paramecium tetraurelia]|uniref:PPM-type phosphatase domain-containing protein n=1 Tax=Paramecium tetraurelia TaxID=5888 RepID=A0E3Z1_PARTE|nr:uncharacterized protein GSPATT00023181001 [Paramecium tetraurelia]CAK90008.1 unnamed protein product [Paramecium tetraurelia]|eukprot:XP_001457405.1 hypothetical protein (macronuclear) [Paramecium tetraurelia strain d4-2]
MSSQQNKQKDVVNKQMTFALNPKPDFNITDPIKINKTNANDPNYAKSEPSQKSTNLVSNSNIAIFQDIEQQKQNIESRCLKKQNKIKHIATRSIAGLKAYTKAFKDNQDTLFYKLEINKQTDKNIFLLADGHGDQGAKVSQFAIKQLSDYIFDMIESANTQPKFVEQINSNLIASFQKIDSNLANLSNIDITDSGTTMNLALTFENYLISANIGDTRTFYFQRSDKPDQLGPATFKIKQLSSQHTPEKATESQRILESGGKIEQDTQGFQKTGPLKVKSKKQDIKGVTITRSFGDALAKQIGIISSPEIHTFQILQEGFLVLATGSILDMIDIIDICRILTPITPPNSQAAIDCAAGQIIEEARKKAKLQPDIQDDYSLILVYIEIDQA